MRHLAVVALGASLSLTLLPAPALAQTPDVAEVVAAERAFAADAPSMGIAGSFNKWSVPEAILIAGGEARTIGEVYPDGPKPADEPLLEWWPNFAGIARSGDLGFTTGGVALNGQRTGHYFTIWKRQPDGSWKWVYDGGSGASATDVPGPETEPVILPVAAQGSASPEQAMIEVEAMEAELAAFANDQKTVHLRMLADNGRLYVAPLPPAIGREAFAEALRGGRWGSPSARPKAAGRRRPGTWSGPMEGRPGPGTGRPGAATMCACGRSRLTAGRSYWPS